MGRGPRTDAQMVVALCDLFNLTPLQAQRELSHNPLIYRLLHAKLYDQAYEAWRRYEALTGKQRKGVEQPSGRLVDEVRRNIRAVREEMAAEAQSEFEAAGRV